MRPDDQQYDGRPSTPQIPQRAFAHTPPSRDPAYGQQEAAANLIRSQLDTIYSGAPPSTQPGSVASPPPQAQPTPTQQTPATPPAQSTANQQQLDVNPYERTHAAHVAPQAKEWQQYHSAWQQYYQKYYEGYYTHHAHKTRQLLEAQRPDTPQTPDQPIGSGNTNTDTEEVQRADGSLTKQQAMQELRGKLLTSVQTSAKKARKSRHFVPITAAFGVVFIFIFLQYNQVFIANVKAYVSPGSIDPQNIVVDPTVSTAVGPEPRLIIPKINVDTPVFYDIGVDEASQQRAMQDGVAHFGIPGANSKPGQVGNTVLSGHSSNDVFAAGDYKFIFMQLEKLEVGDTIYAHYEGTRYTYVVTGKEEVYPNEVGKLIYETDKPVMTLITCTPLGTALRRLLITAEQIHPSPTTATPAPTTSGTSGESATMPGQGAPTVLERIFGN